MLVFGDVVVIGTVPLFLETPISKRMQECHQENIHEYPGNIMEIRN